MHSKINTAVYTFYEYYIRLFAIQPTFDDPYFKLILIG